MQNPTASDYLGLLRGELIEHLRRAKAALEPAGPEAAAGLGAAACAAETAQALAVLRPLGLELLGMLAENLTQLAASLETQPDARRGETADLLRHGIDQLRDGIERRALGRPEGAWAVLAVLNELRAALGMPLVSQARLFAPDLEDELSALAAEPGEPHPDFAEAARGERIVLHRAMYLWFSGREPDRALRKLRRVAQSMRRVSGTALVQRLFLALEALAVGIADQGGPPTQALRRLLLQIDGTLKTGAERGEAAVAAGLPVSLMRNLLFQVGSCGSLHRIVQAVRRSADLRLLSISGFDGRERLAPLLRADVGRVRALVDAHLGAVGGGPVGPLTEALHGLADSLGLAQLGELRRRLEVPLGVLSGLGPDGAASAEVLSDLRAALAEVDTELRAGAFAAGGEEWLPAPPTATAIEPPAVGEAVDQTAASADAVALLPVAAQDEPAAADRSLQAELEDAASAAPPGPVAPGGSLEHDVRDVFFAEATEKVAAMRDAYVTWSAQTEDAQSLAAVLRLLGELKSTGRLVGAHTLSEVCWVLQAALERCRDGALELSETVFEVLDSGVEAVDTLVSAHVSGTPVDEDPREVEQRLYALLAGDPAALERLNATSRRPRSHGPPRAGSARLDAAGDLLAASDLSVADLLADEAADLVETLEEGLDGLASQPHHGGWLVEMRRALRSLATTARYAHSAAIAELSEAFEAALGAAIDADDLDPATRTLATEALEVLRGTVDALRDGRAPAVPLEFLDRLRRREIPEAAATESVSGNAAEGDASAPSAARRALEEQVTILRDRVAELESIVARLARLPHRSGADVADRARALEDLAPCADGLHEVSLAIEALLRSDASG